MFLSRISSDKGREELLGVAVANGLLLLDPKKVRSIQSLELAEYLAKKSIAAGTSISEKLHLEFLLWLAGRKDISRALDEMLFVDCSDILVVSFGRNEAAIKRVTKKKLELGLEKNASPAELERISLGRIAN